MTPHSSIYHLARRHEWDAAPDVPYRPPSLAVDGFIHACGDLVSLQPIAERFYADEPDELLVVEIAVDQLTAEVRWEPAAHPDGSPTTAGDPLFPHVYGPINRSAIVAMRTPRRDAAGRFVEL